MHWEQQGAFTGEVSAPMMREAGAEYVIIGHSERRHAVRRDRRDREPQARRGVRRRGLTPIVCIGETLEQRERERDARRARPPDQAGPRRADRRIRSPRSSSPTSRSGRSAPAATPHRPRPARRTRTSGRGCGQWFGGDAAEQCHIIYGGSVKPENIRDLIAQPERRWGPGRRGQPRGRGLFRDRLAKPGRARYNDSFSSGLLMLYYLVSTVYVLVCFVLVMVDSAPAGQGRRHRERVRRRQQPGGVRRPKRGDRAVAGDDRVRGAVHRRSADAWRAGAERSGLCGREPAGSCRARRIDAPRPADAEDARAAIDDAGREDTSGTCDASSGASEVTIPRAKALFNAHARRTGRYRTLLASDRR